MYDVAAFYQFTPLDQPDAVRAELWAHANELGVKGTILIAAEGINGTVAGERPHLEALLSVAAERCGLEGLTVKWSECSAPPFRRLSVRLKAEIVSMGVEGIDPTAKVGIYVPPAEWDELIASDDVTLIDCRNSYEVRVGSFRGAIDPQTDSFRDFPDYARSLEPEAHGKVAMFCTGGIRCEKATSLMLELGFTEVYHLEGGILRYLEERGETEAWEGDCFVFDRRVAVTPRLEVGDWEVCWGCGSPVSEADKEHPGYERGVTCGACADRWTDAERASKRERHRQMSRASEKGR